MSFFYSSLPEGGGGVIAAEPEAPIADYIGDVLFIDDSCVCAVLFVLVLHTCSLAATHADRNELTFMAPGPGLLVLMLMMIFNCMWCCGKRVRRSRRRVVEEASALRYMAAVGQYGPLAVRSPSSAAGRSLDYAVPEEKAHVAEMHRIRGEVRNDNDL